MTMFIPKYVENTLKTLEKAGFEACLVGGCVRDLLIDNPPAGGPKDWDITTNAKPEEIQKLFPETVYENKFGTVGIKIKDKVDVKDKKITSEQKEKTIDVVEVTTYRIESKYSDKRRPDSVKFAKTLKEDLERRDFTVNAMAITVKSANKDVSRETSSKKQTNDKMFHVKHKELKITNKDRESTHYSLLTTHYNITDLFNGQKDLKNKLIRAVGDPNERFNEDALRMMRAIRFAVVLGWKIEPKTLKAIQNNAKLIKKIANERTHDEFVKILSSNNPSDGILLLRNAKLLQYIIPELEKGVGVSQNKHHTYTVFKHLIESLKHCPSKDYRVRLAALFHDIAKPQTKRGKGDDSTFYNHDIVGARITTKIMKRMAFSNEDIKKVSHLVKNHMFYYNVGDVSEAGIRRLLKKVGKENMKDLMDLRISDRLGSGVPKAKPYKLRHLEYLIDKVSKDPISVKSLKISGETLIKDLKMSPGPKFGAILECLLADVIENPKNNTKTYLKKRAKDLEKIDLKALRKQAKGKIEEKKEKENQKIKKKHWVK